jgi:hypothetical protein
MVNCFFGRAIIDQFVTYAINGTRNVRENLMGILTNKIFGLVVGATRTCGKRRFIPRCVCEFHHGGSSGILPHHRDDTRPLITCPSEIRTGSKDALSCGSVDIAKRNQTVMNPLRHDTIPMPKTRVAAPGQVPGMATSSTVLSNWRHQTCNVVRGEATSHV